MSTGSSCRSLAQPLSVIIFFIYYKLALGSCAWDTDDILEDPYVSPLRISGPSPGFPDPLNPIFTGSAGISVFYGRYQWRYQWHQSIIRYHLLYCPLFPETLFFFISFFYVDPWLTESRIFQLPPRFETSSTRMSRKVQRETRVTRVWGRKSNIISNLG